MGAGGGISNNCWGKSQKSLAYPENNPAVSPGLGFEWRGKGAPGIGGENWYNPNIHEKWNPDLNHPPPIGPHWDYTDANKDHFRVFPDGRVEKKLRRKE
jgi:hypothetical protein